MPSTFCQANTPDPDLKITVKLFVPGWRSCSCDAKPFCFFLGTPVFDRLPPILYFPGLMRARRLRLHRHSRHQCSSPLLSNCFFQDGGSDARPWKLFNVVPEKDGDHNDGPKDNKRLYPVHGFMLPRAAAADAASQFVSSGIWIRSVFAAGLLTIRHLFDLGVQG